MKYVALNNRKIFMIGFGSIGTTSLPLILKHIEIEPSQIEIIADNENNRNLAEKLGVNFECFKITASNYEGFLAKKIKAGDIIVNLSVGVSSLDLISLCQKHKCLYIDSSNEPWRYQDTMVIPTTTFERRQKFLKIKPQFTNGSTALIYHGANPGLVTHFAKRAILDITRKTNSFMKIPQTQNDWARLARVNKVIAMHISELDTQSSRIKRSRNEYVNTWSIEGFLEESLECVGFAFGAYEHEIPNDNIKTFVDTGHCRAIELKSIGANTQRKSWVPSEGMFNGYMIPHPESFSIAELFSQKHNGKVHHPTVHFVYRPCQDAISSMLEVASEGKIKPLSRRLLVDEITEGMDELGILILCDQTSDIYWYGSQLDISEARKLLPGNNATSIQVAAGVLSGLVWIIENPMCGLVEPEQIDFERALEIAAPYLGKLGGYWATWPDLSAPKTTGDALNQNYRQISKIVS